eukprot:Rhum_TRINITY_DN15233_c5_g1::Rhum_TRINITY_DN15233_c5_g1_i6::g.145922::m.145922
MTLSDKNAQTYSLTPWTRNWTKRIKLFLQKFATCQFWNPRLELLWKKISDRLKHIHNLKKREKNNNTAALFKIRHVTRQVASLPLRETLLCPAVTRLCPEPDRIKNIRICNCLNPSLGAAVLDVTNTSIEEASLRQNTDPLPTPEDCPCRTHRTATTFNGHAASQSHTLENISQELREMLTKGRKFRPFLERSRIYAEIDTACDDFVSRTFSTNADTDRYKKAICDRLYKAAASSAPTPDVCLSRKLRTEIQKLREIFVFVPVDKASHDIAVICRRAYLHALRQELDGTATFARTHCNATDIINKHKTFNSRFEWKTSANLPYLYGTIKLHKNPATLRFITGASNKTIISTPDQKPRRPGKPEVSTTPAHQTLSAALKEVLRGHQRLDAEFFERHDMHYYWIIQSADEAALRIKEHTNLVTTTRAAPQTYDFTTMYTKLEHTPLIAAVKKATAEAFEWYADSRGLSTDDIVMARHAKGAPKRAFTFTDRRSVLGTDEAFSLDELCELIEFCVHNTFVANSNQVLRQVCGIPMGGNASPDLANLYCMQIEKDYLLTCIEQGRDYKAVTKKLARTMRYIDDFLCWGCSPPPATLYGMQYTQTNTSPGDVTYLGLRIRMECANDKDDRPLTNLRLSIIDKRESCFGDRIKPLKYTSAFSTAPSNIGRAIMTGATIRAARQTNNFPDLRCEIARVCVYLRQRNHPIQTIREGAKRAFRTLYGTFEDLQTSLYKLVHWVTCRSLSPEGVPDSAIHERKTIKYPIGSAADFNTSVDFDSTYDELSGTTWEAATDGALAQRRASQTVTRSRSHASTLPVDDKTSWSHNHSEDQIDWVALGFDPSVQPSAHSPNRAVAQTFSSPPRGRSGTPVTQSQDLLGRFKRISSSQYIPTGRPRVAGSPTGSLAATTSSADRLHAASPSPRRYIDSNPPTTSRCSSSPRRRHHAEPTSPPTLHSASQQHATRSTNLIVRTVVVPRGIRRAGHNTCYIIAVVQALHACPAFCRLQPTYPAKPRHRTNSSVRTIHEALNNRTVEDLKLIQRLFNLGSGQQDAHEFLLWLINLYTNEKWLAQTFRDRVEATFTNRISIAGSCTRCSDGTHESTSTPIFSINLERRQDHTSTSTISDHTCLNCGHNKRIEHETLILESQIACFHYRRFARKGNTLCKDSSAAHPPRTLDVPGRHYELRSFITHQGPKLDNGHYIAYVDSGNGWYQCDDSNISLVQNVPYDDAYITFYIAE